MINELDAIEDDTDQMQIKLRKMLLGLESRYNQLMSCSCIKRWNGLGS